MAGLLCPPAVRTLPFLPLAGAHLGVAREWVLRGFIHVRADEVRAVLAPDIGTVLQTFKKVQNPLGDKVERRTRGRRAGPLSRVSGWASTPAMLESRMVKMRWFMDCAGILTRATPGGDS
eukprot:scaffold6975_cov117-Isochrysis_galbana.AAC.1